MAKNKLARGYIAVSRSILEHPMLLDPAWLRAWLWLLIEAAWKAGGKRFSHGVVEVRRGQVAVTVRQLAKAWKWPKSNVGYFLKRLESDRMIELKHIRTKIQTGSRAENSYGVTVITICNYDKFQMTGKTYAERFGQSVGQKVGQSSLDESSPMLPYVENHLKQSNHKESFLVVGEKELLHKPKHGATSRDGKWLWLDYEVEQWRDYAADYEQVRGAAIMPERRIEGMGWWFYKLGEALAPKKRYAA
jgi:hypothetical protein